MSILAHRTSDEAIITLSPQAVAIQCDEASLRIQLADGRELSIPLVWFPRLLRATPEQRQSWQLIGQGEGIHWEAVDEDVSVASLLGLPSD
ncbi:MAG: DUF2442 domain-containing protein [Candidatus Viridilinea halotolerans]|uniref:DUF2442 domain-containing protein n=1 Tax=Candidatus Viridilinea halotolerans TaxID=2491704 RepID=A0A426TUF7_9CHLR|nr:MAG: DUF2442 domain-containing protein [Candidatus Viridilinea halotolerans]